MTSDRTSDLAATVERYLANLEDKGVKLASKAEISEGRAAIAAERAKMDAEYAALEATYVVNLTNDDDQNATDGLSFSSGRYGFTVRAISMTQAVQSVYDRAAKAGLMHCGWTAMVTKLKHPGSSVAASYDPGAKWLSESLDPEQQRIFDLGQNID